MAASAFPTAGSVGGTIGVPGATHCSVANIGDAAKSIVMKNCAKFKIYLDFLAQRSPTKVPYAQIKSMLFYGFFRHN